MSREFYGATSLAQKTINELLALPATGREQDWEFEFADHRRIGDMLTIASNEDLNLDERCALSLLLLASLEEGSEAGELDADITSATQRFLRENPQVHEAMHFYWIEQRKASDEPLMRTILEL